MLAIKDKLQSICRMKGVVVSETWVKKRMGTAAVSCIVTLISVILGDTKIYKSLEGNKC